MRQHFLSDFYQTNREKSGKTDTSARLFGLNLGIVKRGNCRYDTNGHSTGRWGEAEVKSPQRRADFGKNKRINHENRCMGGANRRTRL